MAIVAIIFSIVLPAVQAQAMAPAPSPTSDDTQFVLGLEDIMGLFSFRGINRPRDCICADAGGTGADIPHPPLGCLLLQLLLICLRITVKMEEIGKEMDMEKRTGVHNVLELSKKDFEACTQKNVTEMYYSGPTILELTIPGDYYYYCGVGTHCEGGQKLSITVTNAEGSAGTPFMFNAGSENATSPGTPLDANTTKPSSANSIRNIGVVSGLLSFLLSLFI
ncbi:hypothetical protein HHK36_027572 [Tetracentron sinense]|uniref:Phytocyanin domain-containing protein n=1 Tax=Tetracentron sinense TaxID=13715 RepID=A0A834YHS2_TETSI|nr:hypothetical protein HHK36_027572 [Tetracentron sinense]